jgi:type I restriction enzyme S subunit
MKGWERVRLGEVLGRVGTQIDPNPSLEYSEITVKLWGKGVVERKRVLGSEVNGKRFVARTGNFIASRIDARNGAMGLVPDFLDGALVTNDFPLFTANTDRLDLPYLGWLCRTRDFVDLCVRASEGTTNRVRLKEERFLALEIPLPPLPEQRRIVARIEALAAEIDEAKRLRREAVEEAGALEGSVIAQKLSHSKSAAKVSLPRRTQSVRRGVEIPQRVTTTAANWQVPDGWLQVSVAELLITGALVDVKDGNHGANHPRSAEFVANGTPFLMASDIQRGEVLWNEASKLGPETLGRLRVGFSIKDDVLFTHKASIGKTAVADRSSILSPQVTYYRCNPDFIEPRWLVRFLASPLFLAQLAEIQGQSTRDFVSISKQYDQFILLPPLPEQRRIVAELDALQAEVDALKRLQSETAAELDALLPAILDRAFKGEL